MTLRTHHQSGRTRISVVTALALLLQPIAPAMGQAPPPATQGATQKPTLASAAAATQEPAGAGTAAAAPAPTEKPWPRAFRTPSGIQVLLYTPQVSEWRQQRHMVAYGAVGVEIPGAQKPALGSVKVEADTKVSLEERLVNFSDLKLTETNFPTLTKEQTREITAEVVKSMPDDDRVIALDRVLAVVDKSQILPKNVEGVKADPPAIFFSQAPAVLVNIDGDPIWSPIRDN
ncbi:MAG: hypothetical protein ACM3H9_09225, partial [Rhodospirillaceae bacterium]